LGKTSLVVTPAQTTAYTLTLNGSVTDRVTVTVTQTGFTRTGTMTAARTKHTATLLKNGKVFIAGGSSSGTTLASTELYDPGSGTFTATGSMSVARSGHTATLLTNDKVLVTGGGGGAIAELFDAATGTFTATGSLTVARSENTATLLQNGKVLIAGGYSGTDALASAELFDPATGRFTATGSLTVARRQHAATLLQNGMVLLAGGFVPPTSTGNNDGLVNAELYDPATATFTATGSMRAPRSSLTATLLKSGAVLVAGGPHGFEGYFPSNVQDLYDPATGKFSSTGLMTAARAFCATTLLPSGLVLITGGYQGGGSYSIFLTSAELYDPGTGTCTATASMAAERELHTATALPDGTVLIAGGDSRGSSLASAELYR
jgi:phosphohistidine swiveling domain-containing protein